MKRIAPFGVLVLAFLVAVFAVSSGRFASSQVTTNIGSLPTNTSPPNTWYLITDDGSSHTDKTPIVDLPVSIPSPGATSTPTYCGGYNVTFGTQYFTCTALGYIMTLSGAGNLTGGGAGPTPPAINLASPSATSAPSSCAGFSASWALQYYTCPSGTGAVTTILGSGSLTGGGPGPTPSAIVLASPSATACPSSMAGFTSAWVLVYKTGGCFNGLTAGSNIALTSPTGPTAIVAVASPAATALPSTCAGFSSTWALQYYTCPSVVSAITNLAGAGNLTGGGAGPTPSPIALASPSATACPSSVAGFSSAFALTYTAGCAGIIGKNQTAYDLQPAPIATSLATGQFTTAIMIPINVAKPTITASEGYCSTAGSGGGLVTVQFYVSYGVAPVYSTANPVATAVSWATGSSAGGGATFAPTALPTSTTPGNPTWLYAYISSIPTTPPSGTCAFILSGLQTIQ